MRSAGYNIQPYLLNRWSPRAMTPDVKDEELMSLFEAARWAPSSYNAQPWRFLYAKRGTTYWDMFFDLLIEYNKGWARNAAALVVVIARKNFEHNEKPSVTHIFDAGAAWENLALEASSRGLVAHGMEGFDYEKARKVLGIPSGYDVCAMIAIGRHGKKEELAEMYRAGEVLSDRRPLGEIVCEGKFGFKK